MFDDSTRSDPPPTARPATEADALTSARPTSVRYVVLLWLCLAATIAYVCRNSIGVAESTIRRDLGLSEDEMAWVMSGFFLAYALGQIPLGWLGNSIGSRRAIPIFAIAWSLATGFMGLAANWPLLFLSRLANGAAQAGLFPCSTNTIYRWIPISRRAFATGSLASFMCMGGALGVAITGSLIIRFGWRWTFASYSVLGIAWSLGFYLWFRDQPEDHAGVNESERRLIGLQAEPTKSDASTPWLAIYLSPSTWWICGQQFFRAAGQIFFASWFATYLQETRQVTVEQSGFLNSLPLLALVLGGFIGGGLSDYVLKRSGSLRLARSGVAVTSLVLCASFVFGAYFIQQPVLAVMTISLGTLFAAIGGPCGYSITIDMGGQHIAVLFGTMNMVGNLGAFFFIRLVPEIIQSTGSWDAVLVIFGLLYLMAAVFWILINPKGTVLDDSLIRPPYRSSEE